MFCTTMRECRLVIFGCLGSSDSTFQRRFYRTDGLAYGRRIRHDLRNKRYRSGFSLLLSTTLAHASSQATSSSPNCSSPRSSQAKKHPQTTLLA